MATDRIALAQDAEKWELLVTLLSDKGWPRESLTPYEIADRFPQRWQASDNRHDPPLPPSLLDEVVGNE